MESSNLTKWEVCNEGSPVTWTEWEICSEGSPVPWTELEVSSEWSLIPWTEWEVCSEGSPVQPGQPSSAFHISEQQIYIFKLSITTNKRTWGSISAQLAYWHIELGFRTDKKYISRSETKNHKHKYYLFQNYFPEVLAVFTSKPEASSPAPQI